MKVSSLTPLSMAIVLAAMPASAQTITGNPKPTGGDGTEKIELKEKTDEPKVQLDPIEKAGNLPEVVPSIPRDGAEAPKSVAGLEKLSLDQQKAVFRDLEEVAGYLRGVRWLEGLEKLGEIEAVTGDFHIVSNMKGAIYTRMKDYKSARIHFSKAVELTKSIKGQSFHPRFNLAELDFVEHKWNDARNSFTSILNDPSREKDKSTDNLIHFKLLICDLQQKKTEESSKGLALFDQYDADSPAYYFARAAQEFGAGKKEEAGSWLESAGRIYPKEMNEVYNDALVEMGWLETLEN